MFFYGIMRKNPSSNTRTYPRSESRVTPKRTSWEIAEGILLGIPKIVPEKNILEARSYRIPKLLIWEIPNGSPKVKKHSDENSLSDIRRSFRKNRSENLCRSQRRKCRGIPEGILRRIDSPAEIELSERSSARLAKGV